jgi:hypothetical protein
MKKLIVPFLISIFFLVPCFAQRKEKGFLSIAVGPAFPTGKFASKDMSDELSGLAKTGGSVSISYSKLLTAQLAIAVQLHGQHNPVNTAAMGQYLENSTGYTNWKFSKAAWLYGALLAGPESRLVIDHAGKLQLVTKIMAGIAFAKSPGISSKSISATASGSVEQAKKTSTGFIFNTSTGINYAVNNAMFLTVDLCYGSTSKMTFKQVQTTITTTQGTPGSPGFSVQQSMNTMDGKQSISSLNVMFGVGFRL